MDELSYYVKLYFSVALACEWVDKLNIMEGCHMITFEEAKKLFAVDFDTGNLFWKERTPDMFMSGKRPAIDSCKAWNSRMGGKPALNAPHVSGYKFGCINHYPYLAHRVIWLLYTGKWPASEIDHVNGIRNDNRIDNLRDVSHADNLRNQRLSKNSTSGHTGVYWVKRSNRWEATIKVNQKTRHLGYFIEKADAISARKNAEEKFGFHKNHGTCKAS